MIRWRVLSRIAVTVAAMLLGPGSSAFGQSGTTATGTSNKLNPAISLNSLFLAGATDPSAATDGFAAQEFELAMVSIVDAHFRAAANIAFEPSAEGAEAEVALEEGYVTVLGLPTGFGLQAGRFYLPVGRHNQLHTHQFPFIAPPRAVAMTLGEESLGDVGVLVSYLPDLPWYLDLRGFVTDGAAEAFDASRQQLAGGGRIESLWEIGDAATFEAGASVLTGPATDGENVTFAGGDVRFKWRDTRKTYGRAVNWVTEFLMAHSAGPDVPAVYSTLLVRVARQWWTGLEYSWNSRVPGENAPRSGENEARVQLAWVPSEFSALRGELGWVDPADGPRELAVTLQLNFTIGAHPAHKY